MMDHISHHTFNNPYYIPLMEDHHHHHGGADFDPQQWLHHYHQQNDPSISSSSSQFLTATSDPANLLPLHPNFREEQSTAAAGNDAEDETEEEELGAMKEMMFKIAAMQPVDIDPATIRKPRRRNVRISEDPQSVAARHRRERISDKIRILQRLVPGGTKMDTASMLDEAIRYVKFLKRQIRILQAHPHPNPPPCIPLATPPPPEDWTGATTAAVAAPLSPYLFGGNNNAGNSSRPYELL